MTDELREGFVAGLGFALDPFQEEALAAIDAGRSVLVSAPTGSGKTLVAAYGVARHLAAGRRSFYTTPLKALSNQKFHELVAHHGPERVGLLTGDASVNRDAPVVVMTTEVLRNMLLTEGRQVPNLGLVVLDEVHYLQDPFRGGVWEEVLILTPADVQFVALSATVANAAVVGEWFSEVRGPTEVVVARERPIALHHHVAVQPRGLTDPELVELFDGPRLSDAAHHVDAAVASAKRSGARHWRGGPGGPPLPFRAPRREDLIGTMADADLLPAIYFIFSRAGCDAAASQLARLGPSLATREQRERVTAIANARVTGLSDAELRALEYDALLDTLSRGVAPHHAGMVPLFREIVEQVFEEGLLGVVFATETLSLGINMPARSVVLERFSKFSDLGRATLSAGDFTQLTGRAGRRGLDDEGHAIVCFSPETTLADVAHTARAEPPDLHSSFRPSYNLTANLIHHFDERTGLEVLRRSYAEFERRRRTGRHRPLSDLLSARRLVLEDLGYARGWALTDAGQQLRAVYHECDLAFVESVRRGALPEGDEALLAGAVSAFVHEPKRARRGGPHRPTPHRRERQQNDRLGAARRRELDAAIAAINGVVASVEAVERRHGLGHAKAPSGAFAVAIAAWVRGAPLDRVLDLIGTDHGQLSPGDFVRDAKQVGDLLEQLSRVAPTVGLAETAQRARDAVLRSVVLGASPVPLPPESQS